MNPWEIILNVLGWGVLAISRLKAGLGTLRPEDFIDALTREMDLEKIEDSERITRLRLLGETNGEIHSIFEGEGK